MLNELSSTVEEGAEFTLMRINMFGNSNSLHLTSLCEDKSRETFDNDIFHMIRAGWKSAFERQWSPGKLFVDHTTTIVLRLSGLRGMRNSFGKQINSSFSWQLHWEWERERKWRKRDEWGKTKKNNRLLLKWTSFWNEHFSVFKLKSVINNKRMFIVESYANASVLDKHYSAFPLGLLRIDFLFLQLILSSGMCSQRQGNLGGLPLHPRFPIISCFILSGNCCRNNGLPFQKCFAYLCWIYLN